MAQKRFDKELYAKYDQLAKNWVKKILPKQFTIKENENKVGVDLVVSKNNEVLFYIEPEVKVIWEHSFSVDTKQGDRLPGEVTIHLPKRKQKYCGLMFPTLFIVFREDGSEYFCFWSEQVVQSDLVEVHNKYVSSGEMFYDIKIVDTYRDIYHATFKYIKKDSKNGNKDSNK